VATPDTGDEPDGNNVPNIGEFEVPKPENFPKLYKITVTDWTTQRPKADIMPWCEPQPANYPRLGELINAARGRVRVVQG
jgi:hypothetical protein